MLQGRDHWNDKRGWTQLHGGWGKRNDQADELVGDKSPVSKKEWSNLRGAWGKRELLASYPTVQGWYPSAHPSAL